jgi:hypothetical protein
VGVDVLVLDDEDDESLAVAAVSGVGADEVVVASVVEHEASFAAVEAEKGLGCVAGAVVRRAHQQHTVRVLVVDEHCTECDERNDASEACILLYTYK